MKTAEQWRQEFAHMTTKPVCREFFEQGVIEQIQRDAYEQGRKDAMEWVSKECKRLTENLVNPDRHDYMMAYPAKFIP